MRQSILAAGLVAVGLVSALAAVPAQAGQHGRVVSVQGARGHGYVHGRQVSRQPGAVAVSRSTQTNSGRGVASARSATWGGGAYQGGATRSLANGQSMTRSASATRNDDGSVAYAYQRTGYDGAVRSVSGTRP
ncbi:MAG: hypothetical protein QM608_17730 [Caulobacter sp.]